MSYRRTSGQLRVAVLATLAMAGSVAAQDTPRFAGPLLTPAPPLPKGSMYIEPYLINRQLRGTYDGDGNRHDASAPSGWQLALPMQYGLLDRLTVGVSLNAFYDRAPGYSRAFAVGDSSVSAAFGAWSSDGPERATLTLSVRQSLPTGDHDRLQDRRISLATGSGVSSTSLGVNGQAYFLDGRLRARFSTSWRVPGASTGVRGESAFGTDAAFRGRVRLGSAQNSTLSAEYSLSPKWVIAGEVLHERASGTRLRGRIGDGDTARPGDRNDPSSWRFSVLPVVQYHFNDHIALLGGAQISLAGRNSADVFVPQLAVGIFY